MVPKGFAGITVFPFVFLADEALKEDMIFMNHEKIHLRQQLELLVVFFFLWYFLEFLIRCVWHGKHKAYRLLSFEREAYAKENTLNYLQTRRWYSFIKFL